VFPVRLCTHKRNVELRALLLLTGREMGKARIFCVKSLNMSICAYVGVHVQTHECKFLELLHSWALIEPKASLPQHPRKKDF